MIFLLRKRPFTAEEAGRDRGRRWTLARPVLVPGRHAEPPYDGSALRQEVARRRDRRVTIGASIRCSTTARSTSRSSGRGACRIYMRVALSALWSCRSARCSRVFVAFGKPRGEPVAPYAASIVYFACLGAGFIAIELSLLQHLTLLVGHPIFTLSMLLCTILAAGGVGSALSDRVPTRWACLAVGRSRHRRRVRAAAARFRCCCRSSLAARIGVAVLSSCRSVS